MTRASFFALLLLGTASADLAYLDALDADDQCTSGSNCALNALQLRQTRTFVEPGIELLSLDATEEEVVKWHNKWYGRTAGADISATNYKLLMSNVSAQQKAVLGLWNESGMLEKEVNALVEQVERDSGLKVADYVDTALIDAGRVVSSEDSQGSQPREMHVRKWLAYLEQEMGATFKKLNSVDKKTAASGTLMSKNPVPLKLKSTMSQLQSTNATAELMPGDHVGKGDELWRSLFNIISNIHTADTSAHNLKFHIKQISVMIDDFNAGKLIPETDGK
eukprot:CAMPEP_0197654346 /NCGR_PEP_ID=MMETSP1338-20131121/38801_1 /TAXON_ID=43686 ORGANISM="Pelagodinium beii, Strain RCC1491" /NCGR_SAMPLE_ID=MMETSP1338 /ASSEMBLY_ACC=CAM_ASM_000754 /LENGTH=277 /DNA_ID=CAMNT_0043229783 /DNA_START=31 /DNA_END=864 /DNA_ORIENTATION=+